MAKYPYFIPAPRVYKPWIPVLVGYKKTHKVTTAKITALIDSGADVCFCLKDIGVWLGISFKGKKQVVFKTANKSPLETVKEVVTLYVTGVQYNCPFYFSDQLPHETPIILGQLGFFDHFKITFDVKNKEIEIT